MNNDVDFLIKLIKDKKLDLSYGEYDKLDGKTKDAILKYLNDDNYQTGADNYPKDIIGDTYSTANFSSGIQLLIFSLFYEDAEQCGGTLVFSLENGNCKCVADTVECSS